LEPVSGNRFSLLFEKKDFLFILDGENENVLDTATVNFSNQFMCFDLSKESNLAYRNKFDLLDEQNSNLIYAYGHFYLIKRLRRKSKKDPVLAAIILLDNSLNQKAFKILSEGLEPRISFPYK